MAENYEEHWNILTCNMQQSTCTQRTTFLIVMQIENWLSFDTNPLYAVLHESIYCQVGQLLLTCCDSLPTDRRVVCSGCHHNSQLNCEALKRPPSMLIATGAMFERFLDQKATFDSKRNSYHSANAVHNLGRALREPDMLALYLF
jgi:hypothetical protein